MAKHFVTKTESSSKGVVVYVNSQEDAEFLPKTIEGIPLAVYVTGPIVAASGTRLLDVV